MKTFRCERVRPNNGIVEAFLSRRSTTAHDEHALLNLIADDYPAFAEGTEYSVIVQRPQDCVITLRFVLHSGFFSWFFNWLCQFAQRDWATHIDICMRDGSYISAMGDGVRKRPLNYDVRRFTREEFRYIAATADQVDIFEAFLESQIGKPYDYGAVLSFFWPWRDWQSFDAWDCSELIAQAFVECGMCPKNGVFRPSRVTPRDLRWLTDFLTRPADG